MAIGEGHGRSYTAGKKSAKSTGGLAKAGQYMTTGGSVGGTVGGLLGSLGGPLGTAIGAAVGTLAVGGAAGLLGKKKGEKEAERAYRRQNALNIARTKAMNRAAAAENLALAQKGVVTERKAQRGGPIVRGGGSAATSVGAGPKHEQWHSQTYPKTV